MEDTIAELRRQLEEQQSLRKEAERRQEEAEHRQDEAERTAVRAAVVCPTSATWHSQ
jgi:predicted Holliday junction resolvase-like endonuclease